MKWAVQNMVLLAIDNICPFVVLVNFVPHFSFLRKFMKEIIFIIFIISELGPQAMLGMCITCR